MPTMKEKAWETPQSSAFPSASLKAGAWTRDLLTGLLQRIDRGWAQNSCSNVGIASKLLKTCLLQTPGKALWWVSNKMLPEGPCPQQLLTWRNRAPSKAQLKGHRESKIEQLTKWWKKRHLTHFWRKRVNPTPDRISRLIRESILMMLAHLQFRPTWTQGTGPNLSSPPAATAPNCFPDKSILKDFPGRCNCLPGGTHSRRARGFAGQGSLIDSWLPPGGQCAAWATGRKSLGRGNGTPSEHLSCARCSARHIAQFLSLDVVTKRGHHAVK